MPLYEHAEALIRANLASAGRGNKPRVVVIGALTAEQLEEINTYRRNRNLPEITEEIVFVGRHLYESRIVRDGYSIDDVINQIINAMSAEARLKVTPKMTVIENPHMRADSYGNQVNDQAVFECTAKYPRAELYSVIPRGDRVKPAAIQIAATIEEGHVAVTLSEDST